MPVALLLHVPPDVASAEVAVDPMQTPDAPVIDGGSEFTVTVTLAVQPVIGKV